MYRVDELADRDEEKVPMDEFVPHRYIIPLREVIGEVLAVGSKSKTVDREYQNLIKNLGSEFNILLYRKIEEIEKVVSDKNIALSIANMRAGKVKVSPGYDGVYGKVQAVFEKGYKPAQSRLL